MGFSVVYSPLVAFCLQWNSRRQLTVYLPLGLSVARRIRCPLGGFGKQSVLVKRAGHSSIGTLKDWDASEVDLLGSPEVLTARIILGSLSLEICGVSCRGLLYRVSGFH